MEICCFLQEVENIEKKSGLILLFYKFEIFHGCYCLHSSGDVLDADTFLSRVHGEQGEKQISRSSPQSPDANH